MQEDEISQSWREELVVVEYRKRSLLYHFYALGLGLNIWHAATEEGRLFVHNFERMNK